jgi:hypothetical protein
MKLIAIFVILSTLAVATNALPQVPFEGFTEAIITEPPTTTRAWTGTEKKVTNVKVFAKVEKFLKDHIELLKDGDDSVNNLR